MKNLIRIGNVVFVRDKVINARISDRRIYVTTTIGVTNLGYDSEMDALIAFEELCKQLNAE